ncbi:SAM hydrolase/SAM-dependent halogenase family protein [Oceanithermus sp.]
MRTVYFLSDFGVRDVYAGVVRAVLRQRAPGAGVVDLAHDLPPGDLRHAAFQLYATVPYLEPGGVVLAVVDPGVGTARRALAVRAERLLYVLPDNGLISLAARRDPPQRVWRLEPERWAAGLVSATFHGRDVFAPAAAHLSAGRPPAALGPEVDAGGLAQLEVDVAPGSEGEILTFDRFGNAITNLEPEALPEAVLVSGHRLPVGRTFADVPPGEALAYRGSSGLLEIAVNRGSAREALGLVEGTAVRLEP